MGSGSLTPQAAATSLPLRARGQVTAGAEPSDPSAVSAGNVPVGFAEQLPPAPVMAKQGGGGGGQTSPLAPHPAVDAAPLRATPKPAWSPSPEEMRWAHASARWILWHVPPKHPFMTWWHLPVWCVVSRTWGSQCHVPAPAGDPPLMAPSFPRKAVTSSAACTGPGVTTL